MFDSRFISIQIAIPSLEAMAALTQLPVFYVSLAPEHFPTRPENERNSED